MLETLARNIGVRLIEWADRHRDITIVEHVKEVNSVRPEVSSGYSDGYGIRLGYISHRKGRSWDWKDDWHDVVY